MRISCRLSAFGSNDAHAPITAAAVDLRQKPRPDDDAEDTDDDDADVDSNRLAAR